MDFSIRIHNIGVKKFSDIISEKNSWRIFIDNLFGKLSKDELYAFFMNIYIYDLDEMIIYLRFFDDDFRLGN